MGMGINDFYTQATQKDFSRDFQLRVISIGPGILTEADNVYITTANLPGYSITNQVIPFMGLDFNVPGSAKFPGSDSWAVTFRCDVELDIREVLLDWQASIFSAFPDRGIQSTGEYQPVGVESIAQLIVHRRDGTPAKAIRLVGLYPQEIGSVEYDQTGTGAERTVNVTLAYQWWQKDTSQNQGSIL